MLLLLFQGLLEVALGRQEDPVNCEDVPPAGLKGGSLCMVQRSAAKVESFSKNYSNVHFTSML
jgi:hypothetical protein